MAKQGPTQMLPKATVQLAKGTTPLAKSPAPVTPPSAPAKRTEDDTIYEEKDPEAGLAPLAILCMVLAIALLGVNLLGTDGAKLYANPGESSAFLVPASEDPPWEQRQQDGTHKSTFSTKLTEVTKKLD